MTWNNTGDIGSGTVNYEKLCQRLAYHIQNLFLQNILLLLRSDKARILFEIVETDGIKCLDRCQKYNRARAPIFSDKVEFDKLVAWAFNATTDPVTKLLYTTGYSPTFWIAIT